MNFTRTAFMQVSLSFLHCDNCMGGAFIAWLMEVISLLMFLQIAISRLEDRTAISLLVSVISVPIVF